MSPLSSTHSLGLAVKLVTPRMTAAAQAPSLSHSQAIVNSCSLACRRVACSYTLGIVKVKCVGAGCHSRGFDLVRQCARCGLQPTLATTSSRTRTIVPKNNSLESDDITPGWVVWEGETDRALAPIVLSQTHVMLHMMYQVAAKCLPKGLKPFANMRGAMTMWASTRPNKERCYAAGHKHRDAAFPQELASI